MSLLNSFVSFVKKYDLFHPADKLLLAVSGGSDSIVLAELCKQAGYKFIIAHCNFNLRKEEVEAEMELVKKLAARLSCEVFIKEFDTAGYASEKKKYLFRLLREN